MQILPGRRAQSADIQIDSWLTFERVRPNLWGVSSCRHGAPAIYVTSFGGRTSCRNYARRVADQPLRKYSTENQFSGGRRINTTPTKLRLRSTSRLIHRNSGDEQMRFTLGPRYYFQPQQFSLTPDRHRRCQIAPTCWQRFFRADTRHWFTDWANVQYNPPHPTNEAQVERSTERCATNPR